MTAINIYWDIETIHDFDSEDRYTVRTIHKERIRVPANHDQAVLLLRQKFAEQDGDYDYTKYILFMTDEKDHVLYDANKNEGWMTEMYHINHILMRVVADAL